MYVQYGCSFVGCPTEWQNFDSSFTLKWERIPLIGRAYTKNARRFPTNVMPGDIVKGLPVPEGVCHGIFASHVLEHLPLEDFHKALDNTIRILRPGGIFRVIVPDLEWAAREYIRRLDEHDSSANEFLLRETCLGREKRDKGLAALLWRWLTTSEHQWMWDAPSLRKALEAHGFKMIRSCNFGDCEDPIFSLVEAKGRFANAVAIEARRL